MRFLGTVGGSLLEVFCEKYAFFQETVVPSFLIDPRVIWLDFEGSGLPESRKIDKNEFS